MTESRLDTLRMLIALIEKLEIPRANNTTHPITLALQKAAILRWNGDFIYLTADAIDKLTYNDPRAGGAETNLQMAYKLQLRALLSYYHELSHKRRDGISINAPSCTLAEFKEFRATSYDPTQPIVPWWKMTTKSEGLSNWNKSIKPNTRDFKPFREMNLWIKYKESFLITLKAQNLTHLVEENPIIHDDDLDSAQQKFLFKVMKDNFLHHEAKSIVKKYTTDKDTRQIWKELCAFYDSSITTAMYADVLMTYLADVKLHKANWDRGQGEFINHYKIQKNKFNEIAPGSQISDPHAVRMLHNVVSGTPNLAPVLNQYRQARKAAGSTILISFDEYCTLLSEQAQVYDNANTHTKNSYRRTANVHDLIEDGMECEANVHKADDYEDQEPDLSEILEANVNAQRDKGTGRYVPRKQGGTNNQKRQANQMQGRRAYMTQDTWNSISKEDQVKWDSLDDKTKLTVTTYHFNKGKEYALRDAEANKMEAKQHDMVFDADDEDDNSVIEAKNHEVTPPQVNDTHMTRKLYEEEGINFGQILQAQKANTRLFTGVHEFKPEEESGDDEEYTGLEVNSHWFKGFDDDE